MRIMIVLLIAVFACTTSACSWVGRTAGKTEAKLERKMQQMKTGYEEGYAKEKRNQTY